MDFFNDHAVAFALVCASVAVLFGLYLTYWLLSQPAGNERMQEISVSSQLIPVPESRIVHVPSTSCSQTCTLS